MNYRVFVVHTSMYDEQTVLSRYLVNTSSIIELSVSENDSYHDSGVYLNMTAAWI